ATPPARSSPSSGRATTRRSPRDGQAATRQGERKDASCRCHSGRSPRAGSKPKLAARDDDGGAADLDLLRRARDGEQGRRSTDLRALVDLDLVAEADPAVPGEMERERPGGRARRRILADPVGRDEDARLPAVAVAGKAH